MTSERAAVSSAAPNFGTATNYGVGTSPVGVAVGDFNLDGRPDLAVTNNSSSNVSVLLGDGAGSFGAATNFGAGNSCVGVAVGDFNLDGKPDLAVANANFAGGTVSVLLGNGAGSFGAPTSFAVGNAPRSVVVGDFNLDNKPDLAVANNNSNTVSVLLGNGSGGFGTATSFAVGNSPRSLAVGDFNLDGKLDLATANNSSNTVSVLLGNGSGSFGAATNFSIGTSPAWVAVGDFNLDGKPDLATANNAASSVSVLLGDGAGSFGTPASFSVGSGPQSVAVGDFNLDGNPDLAAPNFSLGTLSVLPGDGIGSFSTATNFGVGSIPQGVAVGDFNLDGKPDLAVTNQGSNNVSVLLNCPTITATVSGTTSICAGDMATVTVTMTGGAPPYTVTLTNGGGTQTGNSPLNFTVSPSGTTTYAVQSATAANACNVMGSGSATVTVNSLPGTPTITPTSASVCPSSAGNQASGPAGATSYAWTITNGTITSAANLQNITYTAGASGTVGLMLTVTNANGCAASNTANVAINTSGIFTVTNGNDSGAGSLRQAIADACPGSTITFSGVSTVTLTAAELLVNKSLTIDGGSGVTVTRSTAGGTPDFRIFNIASGSTVALNGLTVSNGRLGSVGGNGVGVTNNGTLTMTNCLVTGNFATNGNSFGGGVFNNNVLTMTNSTISGNTLSATGQNTGAGLSNFGSLVSLVNCTISGNTCNGAGENRGGGLASGAGVMSLVNCTVSGNNAGGGNTVNRGGGIFIESSSVLTLAHSTISNNVVTGPGPASNGGIHIFIGSNAQVISGNTILAGNTAPSDPDGLGILTSTGFNLIGNTSGVSITGVTAGNLLNTNARLSPLGGNGSGVTATQALLPGSPAINAGGATAEVQNVNIGGSSGTFTLTFNGQTTSPIAFNATAATVQSALIALSTIGTGNMVVAGGAPKYSLIFQGTLAGANQPQVTGTGSGGATVTAQTLLDGTTLATDQRGIARPQQSGTDIGAVESRGFTLAINSGSPQTTLINTNFGLPLKVNITPIGVGEPVDGGQVIFTPPMSTATATVAGSSATISGGIASSGTVTANGNVGSYNVAASANGATSINFALTNNVAPTVSQLVRGNASPTNAGSVTFNLLFSESVTNPTASNFTLVLGGAVTGAMITNVVCNMAAQSCVITVNTGTGSGALGLNMSSSTGVSDSGGAGLSNLPFTGEVYTIDKTAPDTMITGNPVNPTNTATATFNFTGSDTGGAGLAGFQCSLDGGSFAPCTSPQNYFGLADGSHTFQVRAVDGVGNLDPTPATYTWLIDTTAPTLGPCPANITNQSAGASCMATVTFTPPTAMDAGGTPTVTCTPASGSSFPLGITTVSCKATDAVNNMSGPCTFTVQVIDTTAPTLSACPANITAPNTANQCSTTVSYIAPTATDNCSTPTVSCSPASGTAFNVGVTTVTCTASDASPDSPNSTCSFTVTINDTQNPTLTCPANIVANTAPNTCAASVSYTTPTASDNCSGATVICSPASGSTFQKGVTTVTCTAMDASNNTASCSFTVTVNDNQNPTITCPSNQTATSLTGNPIPVTFPAPTAADNCSGVTTACVPASGSNFAVGTTTVTCTATDASNRTASCSFTVTVVSCTSITCPTDVSVATAGNSATVNYSLPVPTGSCGTVTCSPAPGSAFNLGVTTVTCASSIGNQSCSFKVTVNRVSGSAFDPLACTGPGNTVQATLVISNNGTVNQTVADTTTFTNLKGVPGSCTLSPNVGTCTVSSGNLSYNATLTPGQTVTLTYLTQVSDLALTGQQVCTNNSVTFNGGTQLAFSVCDVVDCPAAGPGSLIPAAAEAGDQKAGSVLIYNVYTSGATSGNTQNTRINLTNVHPTLPATVHLFFVAEGCSIADSYICLTANQTASFLASDLDPGTTGYLVAVAVNALGCPTNFNSLIGDEYVKFTSGHAANLAAESFAALPGGLPACDANANTAAINFDGVSYNRTPATLSLDNVGSRADGNDTLLIVNRIGGNLGLGASTLGTLFGIFYDDAENALSFSVSGSCQLRSSITNNFPRITPRFETFVPAGRSGWAKIFSQTGTIGITGVAINFNANAASSAGAFNQGHNLHHLTLNATSGYIIPVFPPSC